MNCERCKEGKGFEEEKICSINNRPVIVRNGFYKTKF